MRHLWRGVVTVLALCFLAPIASADTAVVATSGTVGRANTRVVPFQLIGPGTQLNGQVAQTPNDRQFVAGTRADLNATVTHSSTQPFPETVDGTTYPSVWIAATFTFTTSPFAIHSAPPGSTFFFQTPFTMEGTVTGYSDSALSNQVFSVAVSCFGVAMIDPMQFGGSVWTAVHGTTESWECGRPVSSPWTAQDIGSVGVPGVSSFTDFGHFNIAGAGGDIWGTADAFQFVWQPLEGDGELVARLGHMMRTDPFAKAGLMLRQSLAPDAAHVILDMKAGPGAQVGGGFEFMTRASTGGETTFVAGAPPSFDWVLKLVRSGSTVTGSISNDQTSWTLVGSATLEGPVFAGLAVTSHDETILNQALFDIVTLKPVAGPPSSLPQPWREADIGDTGLPGSASKSRDVFTVRGAGENIWGTSDSFHYVYVPMDSSGSATVTVGTLENTSVFAKAGVMIRASTDPSAAHVILDVKPDGSVEFMARTEAGAETTFIATATLSFPAGLRLRRTSTQTASLFTAEVQEGATWRNIGSVEVTLPADALVGLAVTSQDRDALTTATFSARIERNLVLKGGFEQYDPPALGEPGWVSDTPLRQVDAVSQSSQPQNGFRNGACVTTGDGDCGLYQDIVIPENGSYRVTIFATSDRAGGLIGLNINDSAARLANVEPRGFGNYGAPYTFEFFSIAGNRVRVWMYSPSTPGFVAIDEVVMLQLFQP